jgi:anti-sigma regulatory factor (Ser/Thr protein kinase)/CheY-like chemotaxis protein
MGGAARTGILLVQSTDAQGARIREAFAGRPELEVLAEVPTTLEALEATDRLQPDVLVMDVGLDDVAGHDVLRSVRAVSPNTRIVLHARAADVDAPGASPWLARLVEAAVDPVQAAPLVARLVLSEETSSVPVARGFVADLLTQWDLRDLEAAAQLITSELVANAVQHVPGPCALELTHHQGVLRIAVVDSGAGMPDLQVLGPTNERGRGLHLISAFAAAWGVDQLDDGAKLVWAETGLATIGVA